jgi:hypothetical protein
MYPAVSSGELTGVYGMTSGGRMLRNTCCVVRPGSEANGVVRHHEPSAVDDLSVCLLLDGSDWPMTEQSFIKQSSNNTSNIGHDVFFIIISKINK